MLLIHGAGMDCSVWSLQARALAATGREVLPLDLPGHGRRRAEPALPTIEALADWIGGECHAAPAILIGHSMGALAALAAAARHPERVTALCLLGAALRMPVHNGLMALAQAGDPRAIELMCHWALGPRGLSGPSPVPGGWLQGSARALLRRGPPDVLANDLAACDAYASGPAHASAVRCPTLVLASRLDRMTPLKGARELAGAVPGAVLVQVEQAGHMMMLEAPDATLTACRGFIARLGNA